MAYSQDSWMKGYNEALKLADSINGMVSDQASLPASGPEAQRYASGLRRKILILRTKIDSLESLLVLGKLPGKQPLSEKETNRRKESLLNLGTKVKQMTSMLNMMNFSNRDSLLGQEMKEANATNKMVELDNPGLIGLQRQIMKEQDEGLEKLQETVISAKHIALAVNEELDLHSRLIDDLDQHVDATDSRLMLVQKKLAIVNKRIKRDCLCKGMLLSVAGVVALVVVVSLLIKYL